MHKNEISDKLKYIISISTTPMMKMKDINDETNIKDIDSLDFMEIMLEAEQNFMITIPDDEISHIENFKQMVDYIFTKLN